MGLRIAVTDEDREGRCNTVQRRYHEGRNQDASLEPQGEHGVSGPTSMGLV